MKYIWKQANFAWWEIAHGKFRFRHPWKQYLKVGVYTRQCAYHIEALNGYIDSKLEVRNLLSNICMYIYNVYIYINYLNFDNH